MKTSDLTNFLASLGESISANNKELYKKIIESSELKNFDDYEEFYLSVLYPFENFIDGFVRSKYSDNSHVAFLMANSQFVQCHFEEVLKNKEGFGCSADKSRTIIKRLIKFYSTGVPIEFNYEAKETYHLPKSVFKTHDQIIEFYEGLKSLFYGKSEKYIRALHALN